MRERKLFLLQVVLLTYYCVHCSLLKRSKTTKAEKGAASGSPGNFANSNDIQAYVDGIEEAEGEDDDDVIDDSDCIDDEVLRSVEAFSSSDDEQDNDLNQDLLAESLA